MASAAAGALAGALGAGAALLTYVGSSGMHIHALVAGTVVAVGAAFGGLFGRVSRRLFRPLLRVLWATAITLSVWLFLYAFVLMRFFPAIARAVSFLHSLPGAALYGACVGAMPPLRARKERGRSA
jgi:hypothetical protein